jgi:hypothetical protein
MPVQRRHRESIASYSPIVIGYPNNEAYQEFESRSLRQDAFGQHSLGSVIGPEKPRNSAVFRGCLCTLEWRWELSSNVVDGEASGGVLKLGLAIDKADATDHLAEAGWAVQPAPAALRALAQAEDHSQRGAP